MLRLKPHAPIAKHEEYKRILEDLANRGLVSIERVYRRMSKNPKTGVVTKQYENGYFLIEEQANRVPDITPFIELTELEEEVLKCIGAEPIYPEEIEAKLTDEEIDEALRVLVYYELVSVTEERAETGVRVKYYVSEEQKSKQLKSSAVGRPRKWKNDKERKREWWRRQETK